MQELILLENTFSFSYTELTVSGYSAILLLDQTPTNSL
ncbi:hypothetical protein LEP1GSC158_5230 [Leptospira interrogans serovar Zanoni str. LT2156]|uniref:Uncharacterized protein n=1 Tax=Leptospira interrogans serovar Zanoni str. LT2156 TaxID=1001601 RepID=M6HCM6_LEPIR|nr:hypothetical protein LEP1GSC158_5230 [Leptospira interrogans serovar Zanoni str. LT2156]